GHDTRTAVFFWTLASALLPAAQQAAEHATHDLPADVAGHRPGCHLVHGMNQAIGLAAARACAAEQGLVDHGADASALVAGGRLGCAGDACGLGRVLCSLLAAFDAAAQHLVGAFPVHDLLIDAGDLRIPDQGLALLGRDGADLAARRDHIDALG